MPADNASATSHRVVIVGGGFGGLHAARALRSAPVEVTLIDKRNFHLFQPLLYQVAAGELSPANIASPLRSILRKQQNVSVIQEEVVGFDLDRREVLLAEDRIPFDTLIAAAGATHSYFGHDQWEQLAPGLKTIEDATSIRAKILSAFERAEAADSAEERAVLLTFVLVGGGPTGVEMAGAISELSRHSLKNDFRHIDPTDAKILLLDAAPRILGAFPSDLSDKAERTLERLGVNVRTGVEVTDIQPDRVVIRTEESEESIAAHTVLWTDRPVWRPSSAIDWQRPPNRWGYRLKSMPRPHRRSGEPAPLAGQEPVCCHRRHRLKLPRRKR